jgi:SAM-dependent methyltransferase
MGAKMVLSRLPVPYRAWKVMSAFEHGGMNRPQYALDVFKRHWQRAAFEKKDKGGFVALELGPGDSLFSALIAKAFGASKTYLVDVGPFATSNFRSYRSMVRLLESNGFALPGCAVASNLEELLTACAAVYLTDGLSSIKDIPTESVDFVWSQAVLEHVRRCDFEPLVRDLKRIHKSCGVSSHRVDLKDHLGGALNNLRFKHSVWESDFMVKSGFYTNRIRFTEMLRVFWECGFRSELVEVDRWSKLPTPREKLTKPFSALPSDELNISGFDVVLH